ncbi:MAG: hypothetical protein EOO72_00140 [Myxococcaceae bacterium]|nr:MAG: hypothetical protein EOO72_00140 [Myxococcaceae bacterium]
MRAPQDEGGAPYAFRGGRDAKAVRELLALADQDPSTRGELAPAEVLRRWRIGRAWRGYPACSDLGALATHWNHFAQPQAGGPTGPQHLPSARAPPNVRRGSVRAEDCQHPAVEGDIPFD